MLSRFNVLTKEFAMRKLVALCMISASLVGCASVPMGDPARDLTLKQFEVAPDKAGVYIYRNELIGRAVKMDVEVDGKPIGQTAAQSYLYRELTPGKHTVTAKAEQIKNQIATGTATVLHAAAAALGAGTRPSTNSSRMRSTAPAFGPCPSCPAPPARLSAGS